MVEVDVGPAQRAGSAGSRIDVAVTSSARQVTVAVADEGIGIPDDKRDAGATTAPATSATKAFPAPAWACHSAVP
ncbi:ATP-binding protein [Dactylosporangium sp. AC04546]|uniref:ATP-binding protein n=1 Tax=Dactylosporangium sp. AC04546 TaxID=2862460 RepID=UPI001EDEA217|nr:ATP-binding protein [Dactylosporangium sp. AC04546]WVK86610.1 ATP-binding protein [Dactylosporangium sp. AC04546]